LRHTVAMESAEQHSPDPSSTYGDVISQTAFRSPLELLNVDREDVYLVIRFTRHWIHYGFLSHIAVCVLVAAAEGLLGR
jgi:hypothetical protein